MVQQGNPQLGKGEEGNSLAHVMQHCGGSAHPHIHMWGRNGGDTHVACGSGKL